MFVVYIAIYNLLLKYDHLPELVIIGRVSMKKLICWFPLGDSIKNDWLMVGLLIYHLR